MVFKRRIHIDDVTPVGFLVTSTDDTFGDSRIRIIIGDQAPVFALVPVYVTVAFIARRTSRVQIGPLFTNQDDVSHLFPASSAFYLSFYFSFILVFTGVAWCIHLLP